MNINATIRVKYVGAPEGDFRWSISATYNGEQWGNSGYANTEDAATRQAKRAGKDYYDYLIGLQTPEKTIEVDLSTLGQADVNPTSTT